MLDSEEYFGIYVVEQMIYLLFFSRDFQCSWKSILESRVSFKELSLKYNGKKSIIWIFQVKRL